jgi:hypothetical protein
MEVFLWNMINLEHEFYYEEAEVLFTPDFELLPDQDKSLIEPQLIEAACAGFRRQKTPEFAKDVSSHIRGGDLYVIREEDESTGFAMLESFPTQGVIYIAGVVKKPSAPSKIVERIVEHHLAKTKLETLTVRTQNDRVLELLANTSRSVTALDRKAKPEEVDLLNELGLVKPDSDIETEYLIHRGYYGSPMLQGERRRSRNQKVTDLTDRIVYERGDAVYGIGYAK